MISHKGHNGHNVILSLYLWFFASVVDVVR